MVERPRRDRDGEPFEDDFTDDRGASPQTIEESQHDLNLDGEQIDNTEPVRESDGNQKEQRP
jgi:hypothetical protein